MDNNNDTLLNKNSYVAFDASSISDLIINRLNKNEVFTDQNYQGSNISSLIDVISYTFSTLLYYLNKTSSESLFSESQIYENMNRIVKLLNYNPKGKQGQTVAYNINASLTPANYAIPRYSYLKVGAVNFSFTKDIYFTYLENKTIELQNPETDYYLTQGIFLEYPLYTALGAINEIIFLNVGTTTYVDHNNIDVYVQYAGTNKWVQWNRTENLFLNKSNEEVYEVRYNPNQNYEIKFGDNINGKQLSTGDQVLVYYLQIDPDVSTITSNSLNTRKISPFNSLNYNNVFNDTIKFPATILTTQNFNDIILQNDFPSNPFTPEETVEQIRKNAPKSFSYQQRLITANDFKNYISDKHSNVIADCYVVNNETYLNEHMKYLYDIGIKSPQLDNSILFNQVKFSNSCNFNNVYAYLAPLNGNQKYVTPAQKELIVNSINEQKILTADVIPMDPVYMLFDFYTGTASEKPSVLDINNCLLLVNKTPNTRQSNSGIINNIIKLIANAFSSENVGFGKNLDINKLNSDIISLNGVQNIQTYRVDADTYVDGISFLVWNYAYPNLDAKIHNHNFNIKYFQYPVFNNLANLNNRIKIIDSTGMITVTSF